MVEDSSSYIWRHCEADSRMEKPRMGGPGLLHVCISTQCAKPTPRLLFLDAVQVQLLLNDSCVGDVGKEEPRTGGNCSEACSLEASQPLALFLVIMTFRDVAAKAQRRATGRAKSAIAGVSWDG
jgi:hypothetical protein